MLLEKWNQEITMDYWSLRIIMWKNGSLKRSTWEVEGEELQP
jgi:hypothetical protein